MSRSRWSSGLLAALGLVAVVAGASRPSAQEKSLKIGLLFDFTGPVQSVLRRWIGPGARLPEFRSYWGVVLTMTLVFYPC